MRLLLPLAACAVLLGTTLSPSAALATMIQCCGASSDQGELGEPTDPAQLAALFDFVVTDPVMGDDLFTLTLTVENQTPVSGIDAEFNINAILFNGTSDISAITLVSVTDEGAGDVTGSWGNEAATMMGAGTALEAVENVGGFDDFNFSLWEGTGLNNPSVIQPGETSTFVFTVEAEPGQTIDMTDFDVTFLNNLGNHVGNYKVGAKFVSCTAAGPSELQGDCSVEDDSAFGGGSEVIPEPGTLALFALGASSLWLRSRRR